MRSSGQQVPGGNLGPSAEKRPSGGGQGEQLPGGNPLLPLWQAIVELLRLEQIMKWLDRQLRRWPWLYRRLGGKP